MLARLGVDIGGTFTDLVVIDEATGTARVGKVLTTAKNPAHGVEEGIHALLDEAGVRSDAVRAVVHGTTLATNALIERKGAKTALLTTEGFRDALEIRREGRYDMYDLFIDPPPPLVPRHLRREVPERLLADGSILKTLDEAAARRALAELAREGVEALAICLLHAYVNPAHERRLSEIAREVSPGLSVSCSSEVVPEIREYERASTTCANVYVAPLMARYLEDLERRLAALGIDGQLYIMQSSGGTALPPLARRLPVRLVEPGPACYTLGGRHPTVTDADLLLGYLDAEFFLGGRMRLDREAAHRVVGEHVARRLGLDVTGAAWGIHRVVNENMAAAARIHGIERGRDLRQYPLFAFGGAGPVHCWQVAKILKVPRILIPFGAGAMSAYGLLAAPLAFDFVRTGRQRLDRADWPAINRLFAEMEEEGRALLARAGVAPADIHISRIAEMRHAGQGHEVECAMPLGALSTESLPTITASFENAYRALYHRPPHGVPIEALNWRLTVSGPQPGTGLSGRSEPGRALIRPPSVHASRTAPTTTGSARATKGARQAYFAEVGGFVETPVYDRYALHAGAEFAGPAIVEERESTAVVGPGARCRVDDGFGLVVEIPT